jgi:hypothetical protein
MRSSSLSEHLYAKNIIDNPNCLCGEMESTYHYVFKCPKNSHKTQIHHVNLYLECNPQFHFLFIPLIFSYLNNVK